MTPELIGIISLAGFVAWLFRWLKTDLHRELDSVKEQIAAINRRIDNIDRRLEKLEGRYYEFVSAARADNRIAEEGETAVSTDDG